MPSNIRARLRGLKQQVPVRPKAFGPGSYAPEAVARARRETGRAAVSFLRLEHEADVDANDELLRPGDQPGPQEHLGALAQRAQVQIFDVSAGQSEHAVDAAICFGQRSF